MYLLQQQQNQQHYDNDKETKFHKEAQISSNKQVATARAIDVIGMEQHFVVLM